MFKSCVFKWPNEQQHAAKKTRPNQTTVTITWKVIKTIAPSQSIDLLNDPIKIQPSIFNPC